MTACATAFVVQVIYLIEVTVQQVLILFLYYKLDLTKSFASRFMNRESVRTNSNSDLASMDTDNE